MRWGEQTAAVYMLQDGLTLNQFPALYNENTPEERVKMGRYGAEDSPSKFTRHFSLLLDGKLTCRLRHSGYVIFWLRDRIAKVKNTVFLLKSPNLMPAKFSHYTVLPAH